MEMQPTDMRQRAVALIQEAGTLLGMIPHLLDRSDELQASVETTSKQNDDLRKEVGALRTELQNIRSDRHELVESTTALLNDILRLTTEATAKLRPTERRSAFWREMGENPQARAAAPAATSWSKDGQ